MKDLPKYVLAIDGGGTKTDVICATNDGTIVGMGSSGPTSLASTTIGAAGFNLIEGIRQATESIPEVTEFASFVMGLAGLDTEHELKQATDAFSSALNKYTFSDYFLENDSIIALANGSVAKDAFVLISGTGSICYGRNAKGEKTKVSGMDYLLTDQGSGYEIGRMVLRAAAASYDGRGRKTILEELVCKHFEVASVADLKLKVYTPPLNKGEVAELTKLCDKAVELGDGVAQGIYLTITQDLVTQVQTVLRKLQLNSAPVEGVFSGSVNALPGIKEPLQKVLSQRYPLLQSIYPESKPVYGALKLALERVSR